MGPVDGGQTSPDDLCISVYILAFLLCNCVLRIFHILDIWPWAYLKSSEIGASGRQRVSHVPVIQESKIDKPKFIQRFFTKN